MNKEKRMARAVAMLDVAEELRTASNKFKPFASPHEGFAIIKEEVDELWDEVKKQYTARTSENMRAEAKQIAAMAIRFMIDLT